MRWNNDDSECLKTMRDNGWEVEEIATEMGFSVGTIENWIRKCNLVKFRKWSKDEDIQLETLVLDGKSNTICSDIMDRSVDAIRNRKVILGLIEDKLITYSQKADKPTKVYLIDFGNFYKVGTTQQTISQRFGRKYPKYEVIFFIETTLEEALKIEKEWLNNVKHLKFVPTTFPEEGRGFTECFKFEA